MIDTLPPDLRLRTLRRNRRHLKTDRRYVLCWIQQALRATDNPIIDAAVSLGNQLGLPVLVYHGLDNRYPHASHRLHQFILEASIALEDGLRSRGIRFCRYVRRPEKLEPGLVYRLAESAACLVTDDMPAFVARRQARLVARKAEVPVLTTDAACAVPANHFERQIPTTKGFRAAHKPLRDASLAADCDIESAAGRFDDDLCFEHDDIGDMTYEQLDAFIGRCEVDMSLPGIDDMPGSRDAAEDRLRHTLHEVLPNYKWTRNNPADPSSASRLSPYIHFGVLGPREITLAVDEADVSSSTRWKFLDELLTWREYYQHTARFLRDPTSYETIPERAQQTLADHADDPRPHIYSLRELVHGQTDDDVWNAAQRQFLLDGWMHNNLRMYWVKQIHKWRPDPRDAWATAIYLNDHLSLDGRDPSTYGGIRWGFGEGKPAYSESPIYGWVPPKSAAPLLKRPGFSQWVAVQNDRPLIDVNVPDEPPR